MNKVLHNIYLDNFVLTLQLQVCSMYLIDPNICMLFQQT